MRRARSVEYLGRGGRGHYTLIRSKVGSLSGLQDKLFKGHRTLEVTRIGLCCRYSDQRKRCSGIGETQATLRLNNHGTVAIIV